MKKIFFNTVLVIFIILTTLNLIFFTEIIKNNDLREFYFENKELPDNYLEIEKVHMVEVKTLTNISLLINLVSLALILTAKKKIDSKKTGIALITISILFLIAAISFQKFFHQFHLLFFNSNNWLLPAEATLIQTYPLEFFRNRFLLFTGITLLSGIALTCWRTAFKHMPHND
jgi:integral membrane protein (TIGR01906 family)